MTNQQIHSVIACLDSATNGEALYEDGQKLDDVDRIYMGDLALLMAGKAFTLYQIAVMPPETMDWPDTIEEVRRYEKKE